MSLTTQRSKRQRRPTIDSQFTTKSVMEESLICLMCSTEQLEIKDEDTTHGKAEIYNLCTEHGYDRHKQEKEYFCFLCYEKQSCEKEEEKTNLKRRNTSVEGSFHEVEGSLKKIKICCDTQAPNKTGTG